MQSFTQKYTIIQLFEDAPEGTRFPSVSWPFHATIVDTFAIGWDVPTMIKELTKLSSRHKKATSQAIDYTFFGPEKQTKVILLQKTDSLVKLHYDVIELLEHGGLELNVPQYAREGFLPHVTVQDTARLSKGDTVHV